MALAVVIWWMEDNHGLDHALAFPCLGFKRPPAFKYFLYLIISILNMEVSCFFETSGTQFSST